MVFTVIRHPPMYIGFDWRWYKHVNTFCFHCSFCSERFFFDCHSKAKAEEPSFSNSPLIGRQTTVKRAFLHSFWWINALP